MYISTAGGGLQVETCLQNIGMGTKRRTEPPFANNQAGGCLLYIDCFSWRPANQICG